VDTTTDAPKTTDLLIGKAPLTLVPLRNGTVHYLFDKQILRAADVDPAAADRLVREGYLVRSPDPTSPAAA